MLVWGKSKNDEEKLEIDRKSLDGEVFKASR